jgi:PEP-CTERM motif
MRISQRYFHASVVSTIASIGLSASPAWAGRIAVDFGANPSNGQNFSTATSAAACSGSTPASCELSLTGNGTSSAINIGFDINFGGGNVGQLTISENGVVNIGSGLINVFSTDLTSIAANGTVFDTLAGAGEIMYSRGIADPEADGSGNYNLAEAVNAFHVTWAGVLDSNGNTRFMQMLLYDQGAGNFDLRMRYGLNDGDTYALTSAAAGFSLGSNSLNITGPLVTTTDYFYRFRDGRLQTSSSVPEPGTLALLGLGLFGIASKRRRRVS